MRERERERESSFLVATETTVNGLCVPYLLTYSLHGAEPFLRTYPVISWSRNTPHFMEAEGSLPLSKVPAICPNPDPDESSPIRPSHFMWIHLNIILLSMSRSFNCLFSLRVFHQNPVYTSPLPHTYPAHLRLLNLVT